MQKFNCKVYVICNDVDKRHNYGFENLVPFFRDFWFYSGGKYNKITVLL